jgi:prephenate dehydrogenase
MTADLRSAHVCIIGLGLMGGSLGMALRAGHACASVTGSDRVAETRAQAIALGSVDSAFPDARDAVRQADLVILATPVRAIVRLLGELAPAFRAGAIVMDLGSVKSPIVAAMAGLPPDVQPIGGHPMCGKERAGLAAADPGLFRNAVFCLAPLERTSAETLAVARDLVAAVGARSLVIESRRHDRLVAVSSHLPYLVAAALTATAGETAAGDDLLWMVTASGFRDTSRLAGSDVDMMMDILLTNSNNVASAARRAAQRLAALADAIAGVDEERLRSTLAATQQTWQEQRSRREP